MAIGVVTTMAYTQPKKMRLFYPFKGGVSLGLFYAYGLTNQIFFGIGSAVTVLEIGLFGVRLFR